MYVRVNIHKRGGKEYRYAFLMRGRWTSQGPRHEVVHNFGKVTAVEGQRLQRAFRLAGKPTIIVGEREEFRLGDGLLLAPLVASERQWKPLGLGGVLEKKRDEALLETLVINRCLDPMSKIAVTRWYHHCPSSHPGTPSDRGEQEHDLSGPRCH